MFKCLKCESDQNEPDTDRPPTDDFEDFRMQCADLTKEITLLLPGPQCFTIMFGVLREESQQDIGWDRAEAILWTLSAIAPQVGNDCPAVPGTI